MPAHVVSHENAAARLCVVLHYLLCRCNVYLGCNTLMPGCCLVHTRTVGICVVLLAPYKHESNGPLAR